MSTEEEDFGFLGFPSPEEMLKQHIVLLQNEIDELNQQLRAGRENAFKLVEMLSKAQADRDSVGARLRQTSGEANLLRQKVRDLEDVCAYRDQLNEDLRRQIPEGPTRYLR
ncbi:hypothetical protein [Pseudomonas gingeri]